MADESTTTPPAETPHEEETVAAKVTGSDTRTVPLSEHIELRKQFKALKASTDTELAKLRAENATFSDQIKTFTETTVKQAAFDKALGSIGDGFELPADRIATVKSSVSALAYDAETIEQSVANIVELAKRPKAKAAGTIVGKGAGGTGSATKEPHLLSGRELEQLRQDDPDEYKRVTDLRNTYFREAAQQPGKTQR